MLFSLKNTVITVFSGIIQNHIISVRYYHMPFFSNVETQVTLYYVNKLQYVLHWRLDPDLLCPYSKYQWHNFLLTWQAVNHSHSKPRAESQRRRQVWQKSPNCFSGNCKSFFLPFCNRVGRAFKLAIIEALHKKKLEPENQNFLIRETLNLLVCKMVTSIYFF